MGLGFLVAASSKDASFVASTPFCIINIYPPFSGPINVLNEELDPEVGHKAFIEKDVHSLPVRGRHNFPKYLNLLSEFLCH
jgi:hypothetical protein